MMKDISKEKIIGIVGTVIVHIMVLLLLYFLVMTPPPVQAEKGIAVLIGDELVAYDDESAMADSEQAEPVQVSEPQAASPSSTAEPVPSSPVVTQDVEQSIDVTPVKKPQNETPHQPTAAELQAQRDREAEAERQRLEAESQAQTNSSVANAFARGNAMSGSTGAAQSGSTQGSPAGNSNNGIVANVGNRTALSLPRPTYNEQAEGRVVVNVTVRPDGSVSNPTLNLARTNTQNEILRNAALDAARYSKFNSVQGVNNTEGTIEYNFKLR